MKKIEVKILPVLAALGLLAAACGEDPVDTPAAAIVPKVTVNDQTLNPADRVLVTTVVAAQNGFVVIHEANEDGDIGGAIGNTFISKGTSPDVTVNLDRDGVDGETLFAMLHIDGDGNGEYLFPNGPDTPVLDATGAVIAPPFTVTVGGGVLNAVTVADQVADPADQVVIEQVLASTASFIAVHEGDGAGGIGGVIGVSAALEAGTTDDVEVTLDRDAVNGETLFAMLHVDGNANGIYEFPGPDVPVLDDADAVIAPPFVVSLLLPEGPLVEVADQEVDPADEVIIDRVIFDRDGFIAVHESDEGGAIGDVIGVSALLEAGVSSDVVVTLDRDAVDGEQLFAMLHLDEPANGVYEFPENGDAPALDINDALIAPSFVVTLAPVEGLPSVEVDSQLVSPASRAVVREVISVGPGFIVIHEDNGQGGIGDVVGLTAVSNGRNTNVAVVLDKDAVNGERFFAMLHDDANDNGIYEFPGPDVPITDANGVVIAPPYITFVGAPGPAVVVDDQTADPSDVVTVLAAVSDGPGFIAVHEDDGEGGFGGVIGVSALLSDGVNANIRVTLERDVVGGETLFAMLHADDPANGVYEFPENGDVPIFDGQGIIAPPFIVSVVLTDAVEVDNQTAAPANRVVVRRVVANRAGFIAVHEGDGQGGLGGVIGVSALLPAGFSTDVEVLLERNANNGEVLFAMLHVDDPANGVYEFPDNGDGPVFDANDAVIAPPFTVTVPNAVFVDSQVAGGAGNEVVVREVIYGRGGFIAVHEGNGGGGIGDVIGVSAFLPTGTNFDVAVTLDRPAVAGEVLFAMLHADANDNQTYEFPGPDVPALFPDDSVIAPPFAVLEADVEAVVAIDQRLAVIDQISVLAAFSEGPGFIAVHEDDGEGGIGGVIGVSAVLFDGVNSNILVDLDRNANNGETLFAMLHDDANNNGIYEFPGVDVPIIDDGGVIAPPFIVTVR